MDTPPTRNCSNLLTPSSKKKGSEGRVGADALQRRRKGGFLFAEVATDILPKGHPGGTSVPPRGAALWPSRQTKIGSCRIFLEADARTRTGDPFITRKVQAREARVRAS